MTWTQNYSVIGGSLGLTALAAVFPMVYLFWAFVIRRMPGHFAGGTTLILAGLIAVIVYGMPIPMAISAAIFGGIFGLWPIGWIVVAAVFLYNLTLETGQFEVIKYSISSLTEDRRLQVLLIAFCFGAFLESVAGFGTPVAIASAVLIGLGFSPLYAAGLCLIANTVPVVFASNGLPIITAAQVTGISDVLISQMAGRQLPFLALVLPLYMIVFMAGWKAAREVWPAILVTGVSFALLQWYASNYLSPMLPGIISAVGSLLALTLLLRVWKPARTWRFRGETDNAAEQKKYGVPQVLKAWAPFALLIIMMGIWGHPSFKLFITERLCWLVSFPWPILHDSLGNPLILKSAPIAAFPTPYPAIYRWDFFSAGGTAIFLTSVISACLLRIKPVRFGAVLLKTLRQLKYSLMTISSLLAMAYLVNYSGQSYTLGLTFAATGILFPFLSPILGLIGTFLTGSDTSANALFGKLQQVTAEQIGVNPVLTVAANSVGGVAGKMISPQSIAVACGATGLVGKEAELFRFTLKHSLLFAAMIGILTFLQAYVLPWMIPVMN